MHHWFLFSSLSILPKKVALKKSCNWLLTLTNQKSKLKRTGSFLFSLVSIFSKIAAQMKSCDWFLF